VTKKKALRGKGGCTMKKERENLKVEVFMLSSARIELLPKLV